MLTEQPLLIAILTLLIVLAVYLLDLILILAKKLPDAQGLPLA